MPAVTVDNILALPKVAQLDPRHTRLRPVRAVTTAPRGFEGEGFPVRRAFAGVGLPISIPSFIWIRWARSSTRRASPRARPGIPIVASRR